jgi:hypothetical protein
LIVISQEEKEQVSNLKVQHTNTMKIQDILKEQDWKQDDPDFKSKKTGVDPVTGTISWDIEYTPLKGVDDAIEDAYQDYKAVLKKYPEDQKLEQLFNIFSSFKKAYRTHVNRKYGK